MMSEDEWRAGVSAGRMLQTTKRYSGGRSLNQKYRLFTCHLLRRLAPLAPDGRFLHAVETAERHLDGAASQAEVAAAVHAAVSGLPTAYTDADGPAVGHALRALPCLLTAQPFDGAYSAVAPLVYTGSVGIEARAREIAPLLHELFGNPFRPVAFAAGWRTSSAVALARTMYESRVFDRMPILADALEEAGCEEPAVLAHCRDPDGVHVRGCWVVDGVLGKA